MSEIKVSEKNTQRFYIKERTDKGSKYPTRIVGILEGDSPDYLIARFFSNPKDTPGIVWSLATVPAKYILEPTDIKKV